MGGLVCRLVAQPGIRRLKFFHGGRFPRNLGKAVGPALPLPPKAILLKGVDLFSLSSTTNDSWLFSVYFASRFFFAPRIVLLSVHFPFSLLVLSKVLNQRSLF